jgi:hypothetical protein
VLFKGALILGLMKTSLIHGKTLRLDDHLAGSRQMDHVFPSETLDIFRLFEGEERSTQWMRLMASQFDGKRPCFSVNFLEKGQQRQVGRLFHGETFKKRGLKTRWK